MNLQPLGDRVVVKPLSEEESKTPSGIYIPDTAKEKPQVGKIVAVGKGKMSDSGSLIKMDVKVNDKVLYGKYSGTEISFEGDELLIMRESDILAIL